MGVLRRLSTGLVKHARHLSLLLVLLGGASLAGACSSKGGSNCAPGTEGCRCDEDGECESGLRCASASGICQRAPGSSASSSSGGTGGSGGSGGSGGDAGSGGGFTSSNSSGGDAGTTSNTTGTSSGPRECVNVECNSPPCCGDSCSTNDDCCLGTICSLDGDCIPESCSSCGDLGCFVDYDACTMECARPTCCQESCSSDGDCCTGAICSTSGTCIPQGCGYCGGMRSFCSSTSECDFECVPPPTCGDTCSTDSDCGTGTYCNEFQSGASYCVPDAFQDACNVCDTVCSFSPGECEVSCPAPAVSDTSATSTGGSGSGGSASNDVSNIGSGGSGGGTGGTGSTVECSDCCSPCSNDSDCCSGRCREEVNSGDMICMPASCEWCDHGCTFRCPT